MNTLSKPKSNFVKSIAKLPIFCRFKTIFIALFALAPIVTWWLAQWPGVMTNDSLLTWSQVKSGKYEQFHTVSYTVFVWLFSLGGSHLAFVALAQSCILFYSVYRLVLFCNSNLSKELALLITACLYWLPYLGAMGITLWKDVPFTSLTVIGLIKIHSLNLRPYKKSIPAVSILSVGLSFRHDGILFAGIIATILLSLATLIKVTKRKKNYKFFVLGRFVTLAAALSIIFSQGLNHVTSAAPSEPFFQKLPLIGDIAYVARTFPDQTPESIERGIHKIAKGAAWEASLQCSNLSGLLFSAGFSKNGTNSYSDQVFSDLIKMVRAGLGAELFNAHLCRAMSFIPPPLSAGPSYSYWTASGVAQTEYNKYNLQPTPPIPELSNFMEKWRMTWEKNSSVVAWPGLIFAISLILIILNCLFYRKNSIIFVYLTIIMGSRLIGLVLFTLAQDFRYAFVVHIIFLVLVTTTIINLATFPFTDTKKNANIGK